MLFLVICYLHFTCICICVHVAIPVVVRIHVYACVDMLRRNVEKKYLMSRGVVTETQSNMSI